MAWRVMCAYFDNGVKFRELLEFTRSVLYLIDGKSTLTTTFHCEVLTHMAQIHQSLQDRVSALRVLTIELPIIKSHCIILQKVELPESKGTTIQHARSNIRALDEARSKHR